MTLSKLKFWLTGGPLLILVACPCAAQETGANNFTVWSVNEFVQTQRDVDLAARVPSEVLIRGWFKWANVSDVSKYAGLVDKVHANKQLFGGGVTLSALYRGENGIDEQTFLDMATRDPNNKLYPAFGRGNYFHGTLSNPRYVDYCLKWVFHQIDSGVEHLFMDEVDAAHGEQEGYDDYAIKEFRSWLLTREKLSATDPKWQSLWRIPLDNPAVCPDGSLRSLDFRGYLQHHQATAHPWGEKNPLAGLWLQFVAERDDRVWKEICDRTRAYATRKGRKVLIAANGLNRHVDHQIQNLWEQHLFLDKSKRVDGSRSLLAWGSDLVHKSRTLLGREVPIVVFHDWGFGMPWQNIPVEERNLWLRIYVPELYASGVFFAFPVHGPFGCDSEKDGTLPTIIEQANFFRRHADYFRVGSRVALDAAVVKTQSTNIAIRFEEHPASKSSDCASHQPQFRRTPDEQRLQPPDHTFRPRNNPRPSPSMRQSSKLRKPFPLNSQADSSRSRSPAWSIMAWWWSNLTVLTPIAAARLDRDIVIMPRSFWHKSPVCNFTVSPGGMVSDLHWVSSYLHGKLHTQLRDTPAFNVEFPNDGKFEVSINSVSTMGGILEIYLDDKLALRQVAGRQGPAQ